ncbi:hypothetical protein GS883_02870 [Rhodococcus hoagii]|nr:hypothetical protein [Prescottella equi]
MGALAAALAVAAHGVAGGGFPGSPALTLLLAACAAVGAAAGGVPVLSRSRTALFGALAAGQGAGHLALTVSADGHLHQGVPVVAMLAAHTAATVVCAGLVLGAERLYGPITRVLRAVLAPPVLGVASATRVRAATARPPRAAPDGARHRVVPPRTSAVRLTREPVPPHRKDTRTR